MLIRNLSVCALVLAVMLLTSADSCNPFSVSVTAKSATINTGATTAVVATAQHGTGSVSYSWTLQQNNAACSPGCGTLSASTGANITYTAPATVPPTGQVTITANGSDSSKETASGYVIINIEGVVSVSVSPAAFSFAPGGAPQSFTATVVNDPTQKGVTWSLSLAGVDCASSSAPCGSISDATSTSVMYTPPTSAASAEQVALTATPVFDTNITASAILSISAGGTTPLTLSVSPTTATATPGGATIPFTATISGTGSSQGITWGLFQNGTACPTGASSPCGSLSSTSANPVTYTPPASASSTTTVTLTATAVASSSVTTSATITVQPQTASSGIFPRYLFEVNGDTTVSSYAVVAPTGQLRSVTRFAGSPTPFEAAAINPVANVIYIVQLNNVSGGNASVTTLAFSPAGQITESGSNFNGNLDGGAYTIAVDPEGRYLYGTDSVDHQITLYTLDLTSGLPTLGTGTAISPDAKFIAVDSSGTFLYVEDTSSNVLGYQIGANGALTAVGSAPSSHPTNGGGPIAVDPQNHYFVAVDNGSQPQLYAYALNSGSLIPVSSSPFTLGAAGGSIGEIAIDPTGTYLYAVDVANNQLIGIFNNNGVFTPIPGSPFAVPSPGVPKHVNVDPSGKNVYVQFEDTQEVWAYSIATGGSAPGALSLVSKMRTRTSSSDAQLISAGPHPVTFTPQYLYVANSSSNTLGEFSIAPSSGALTSLGTPVTTGTSPYDVVADPNPALPFVYAADQGSAKLSGYEIGSTGTLTALPDSPYSTGNVPEWLAMDLTGTYLFNVNSGDGTLTSFVINTNSGTAFGDPNSTTYGGNAGSNPIHVTLDPNGLFAFTVNTPASGAGAVTTFTAGGTFNSPTTIAAGHLAGAGAVHPSGEYFYVANGDNTISEYSISASNGALTSIGTVTVTPAVPPSYGRFVGIEPSGHFLYYLDGDTNLVYIFSIDPSTGLLTASTSPAVATGTNPYAMTVDISGTYLYVSNLTSGDISVFSIDPSTGNLTPVGTTTEPTGGTSPRGMTTTGTLQ